MLVRVEKGRGKSLQHFNLYFLDYIIWKNKRKQKHKRTQYQLVSLEVCNLTYIPPSNTVCPFKITILPSPSHTPPTSPPLHPHTSTPHHLETSAPAHGMHVLLWKNDIISLTHPPILTHTHPSSPILTT